MDQENSTKGRKKSYGNADSSTCGIKYAKDKYDRHRADAARGYISIPKKKKNMMMENAPCVGFGFVMFTKM